jgi:hypothetical protein
MIFAPGVQFVPDDTEGPVHPHILAIRAYQRMVDAANAPPQEVPEGEAGEVVPTVKPPTKTAQAKAWLADMLQHGPVPATVIQEAGLKAGFNLKMLKEAKKRLRVVSARKGRKHFVWQLPRAKPTDDGQA